MIHLIYIYFSLHRFMKWHTGFGSWIISVHSQSKYVDLFQNSFSKRRAFLSGLSRVSHHKCPVSSCTSYTDGQFLLKERLFVWILMIWDLHGVFNLGCHLWLYCFCQKLWFQKMTPNYRIAYNSAYNSADKSLRNLQCCTGNQPYHPSWKKYGCLLVLLRISSWTGNSRKEDCDGLKSTWF